MEQKLSLPLPVVARELTELAQKKSTYSLRCASVLIPLLITIAFLATLTTRSTWTFSMVGRGSELLETLFWTLTCILYALGPALSCSAITSEKEKQTLGLLLISRLTPFTLILEKICSRMIPLLSFILVASPLFGISFLLGGVTLGNAAATFGCLLYIALQITVLAVCVSSLMKSGVAAFWVSYAALFVMYFAGPILSEANLLPRNGPAGNPDSWFCLFPPFQLHVISQWLEFGVMGTSSFRDVYWATIPSLILTTSFLLIGWRALILTGDSGGLSIRHFLDSKLTSRFTEKLINKSDRGSSAPVGFQTEVSTDKGQAANDRLWSNYLAAYRPILWRELSVSPLRKTLRSLMILFGVFLLFVLVSANANSDNQTEEGAAFILCSLVLMLLAMMGLSVRIFAKERDAQTLESLLTIPTTNRQLLDEKMAVLNRTTFWLASPILMVAFLSTFVSLTPSRHDGDFTFLFCVATHTFLYLHLVKWVAVYFGLRQKTQVKAMTGSLMTVLIICFGPAAIFVTSMVITDTNPGTVAYWFYSSPLVVMTLGAFRDLRELYQSNSMPDSALLCVGINLAVYYGVMYGVKSLTIKQLPRLLNRID